MFSCSDLKAKARAQLNGRYGMMLGVTFIYSLIVGLLSSTVAGALLLAGPMMFGLYWCVAAFVRGNSVGIEKLFCGFSDFARTMLLGLMYQIYIFLWSLLFIIPGIIKALEYSMAFFVMVDHPEMDWKQCLAESSRLTNGYKGKLFLLQLSFIGWYLLSILTCGIGTIFLMPYVYTAMGNAYEQLKANDFARRQAYSG